ncbi:MAG: WGR domain-containing protein [Betaproteobacteria bacterium]|nr:WGR domain-containing protein [Betaproteobacteria bacterium]
MKEVLTDTCYMEHEGGTKFYEVVRFSIIDDDRHVVVFRYGKMKDSRRRGQTKVEQVYSLAAAQNKLGAKANEKNKRGYKSMLLSANPNHFAKAFAADNTYANLLNHYDNQNTVGAIMHYLGLGHVVCPEPLYDGVVDVVKPEPNRGADWGSW